MWDKIRVGIIGLGYMGGIHLKKLLSIKEAKLTAVYDINKERYKLVKGLKVKKCRDVDEIVKYVDAIIISSPTTTHYEYLKYFLMQGLHCLSEKPPAVRIEELNEVINLSEQKGLIFNVVMPERKNPVVEFIFDKASYRGLVFISDRVSPYTSRSLDISVLYDIMIHDLDLLNRIISRKIKEINATGLILFSGNIDVLNVRIEYDSGIFAILNASRVAQEKKRNIRIFYNGGYISADLISLRYTHITPGRARFETTKDSFDIKYYDPLSIIDKDFIDSILNRNKKSPFRAVSLIPVINLCNEIEKYIKFKELSKGDGEGYGI